MTDPLFHTVCHGWHQEHNARLVDFAGWKMPIQYSSITEEHHAVRRAAGLFDIAHMGRLAFIGPDSERFLDHILTNRVEDLQLGQVRYALVCNESGGMLDDVLVYRFDEFHMLVVNASNRMKILDWIEEHRGGFDFHLHDWTFERFMLALQGPAAGKILNPLTVHDISETPYYWGAEDSVLGVDGLISRTGYTGEDGFEVVIDREHGLRLWETLIERGRFFGLEPCGLGCRDTLRLEAAMPLYGHELSEEIDPYTAGLGFAVKLDKEKFIGRDALVAAKANPNRPRRVGLELTGRRIARESAVVYQADEKVGEVTSGTFSPTLEKSIAMAYVAKSAAEFGAELEVDIRGKRFAARVVKLPFYNRR